MNNTSLGPDWIIGPEGIPERDAARVVLFDPGGRIGLVRGHDSGDTAHEWWFTVGGGRHGEETPRQTAVRELAEETDLHVAPDRLIGPVLTRSALFRFARATCRQREDFFLLHLTTEEAARFGMSTTGLTELERDVLDEMKWWDLDELAEHAGAGHAVYPTGLADYARSWREGWDGGVPHLDDVSGDPLESS
ncbi:MAG: NUDIX domain-containing protein [Flaviflexus sp.]|nr:NUDIX domain-containing protein [Flaviflexus sp.]